MKLKFSDLGFFVVCGLDDVGLRKVVRLTDLSPVEVCIAVVA